MLVTKKLEGESGMRIKNLKRAWYWTSVAVALFICIISTTSIWWLREYSRQRSQQLFEQSVAQFQLKLETYLEDFRRVAKHASYYMEVQNYLFSSSQVERMRSGELAIEQVGRLFESYPTVKDIVFLTDDYGNYDIRGYYGRKIYETIELEGEDSVFSLEQAYFEYVDPVLRESESQNTAYFQYVFPVYSLLPGEFSPHNSAVCVVLGNLNDIPNFKEDFDISYDALMILEDDKVIFSDQEGDQSSLPEMEDIAIGWGETKYKNRKMLSFRTEMKGTNWDVAFLAQSRAFLEDFYPMQQFLAGLLVFSLVSMFLIMLWSIRVISIPIKKLKSDLEEVRVGEENDVTGYLQPSQIEEIDWIRQSINRMIQRIEEERKQQYQMEEQLYRATISAKQSLLQYYQSQINPHFLYNSLECIRAIAQLKGVKEISEISMALANLFRYSIGEDSEVTLEMELQNVKDYFEVISVRKPGQYEMRMQCEKEVEKLYVTKMILQPVVENAMEHGFQNKQPPYILDIRCQIKQDGLLHISVVDNGMGIPKDQLEHLRKSLQGSCKKGSEFSSIGLKNLYNRLSLSYEDKGSVQVFSKEECFTKVELTLPVRIAKGEKTNGNISQNSHCGR